jgi:hypothetical protein
MLEGGVFLLYKEMRNIFIELESILSKEKLLSIKNCRKSELGEYSFGIGTYLRNRYFWNKKKIYYLFCENGVIHPDEMSIIVLANFQKYLREKK